MTDEIEAPETDPVEESPSAPDEDEGIEDVSESPSGDDEHDDDEQQADKPADGEEKGAKAEGDEEPEAFKNQLAKFKGDKAKAGADYWRLQRENKAMARRLREAEERVSDEGNEAPPETPEAEQEPEYSVKAHLAEVEGLIQLHSKALDGFQETDQKYLEAIDQASSDVEYHKRRIKEIDEGLKDADEFEKEKLTTLRDRMLRDFQAADIKRQNLALSWRQFRGNAERANIDLKRLATDRARLLRAAKDEERNQEREAQEAEKRRAEYVADVRTAFHGAFQKYGVTEKTDEGRKVLDRAWPLIRDRLAAAKWRASMPGSNKRVDDEKYIAARVREFMGDAPEKKATTTVTPSTPEETRGTPAKPSQSKLSPQEELDRWRAENRKKWSRAVRG